MDNVSETASSSSRPTSPVPNPNGGADTAARPFRFQWDPASRRPGPGSVISETTEGRGDYFASGNPRLDLYNHSSASLALGALPAEWSSSRHGFHAISTVLNNPHKRAAPPKAHSALPAVPPAQLPRVKRKDFDPYLQSIAPEWERFERSVQLAAENVAQVEAATPPPSAMFTRTPITPHTPRSARPFLPKTLPPLTAVPPVFFEPSFNLGEARTFNAVTEQHPSDSAAPARDPSSLSHSLPLLEKLSHYADTVEQHLVREISLRSTSFFAALTNLQDLQTESEQCLDRIARLRTELRAVDDGRAKKGLQVVRRECTTRNVARVRSGVRVLAGVVEMTGVARGLVNSGQWGEALGVVEEIERLWQVPDQETDRVDLSVKSLPAVPAGLADRRYMLESVPESPSLSDSPTLSASTSAAQPAPAPTIPLSSLKAFSALPSHLRTLTLEIAHSLSTELVGSLRADLSERVSSELSDVDKQAEIYANLRNRLRPLLDGLVRTKSTKEALVAWREAVAGEVKGVVSQHIPEFGSLADNPSVATALQSMAHSEFMELLRSTYTSLLRCVEGLQAQNVLILDLLEPVVPAHASVDIISLRDELGDVLSSAAELTNAYAAQVIGARAEQHAALALAEFVVLFDESWRFMVRCEVICRRMIVGLRGAVVSQAKTFLQAFHQTRISQSAKLVEDEQWNPAEVQPFVQHYSDLIVDSAMRDPPELMLAASAAPPTANGSHAPAAATPSSLASPTGGMRSRTNGVSSPTPSVASSKHLRIEERAYFAVPATLETLALLVDYLRALIGLPMLTTDAMGRVIEFLKAFNSRTCQVVLGAGAMRSAGLKNITAKHLALASQSLSIMITLVPYVREMFRRHLSPKQAVMLIEFDKLKRDYQDHQDEIHAKLIAIMGDRLTAHIRTLQLVQWDVPAKPGQTVNEYMELLVKETVTLHKVLSRYLSIPVVEYVMSQVFASINHRLSEEYSKIDLPNQEAKDRLLTDARYLHDKFSVLKNVRMPTNMLETVVADKRVMHPLPPPRSPQVSHFQQQQQQQRAQSPTPRSPVSPAPPAPAPAPGTTANQRIKGMFARAAKLNHSAGTFTGRQDVKAAAPAQPPPPVPVEKALPDPSARAASPAPAPASVPLTNGATPHPPAPTPPAPTPPARPVTPARSSSESPAPPPPAKGFREVEAGADDSTSASPRPTSPVAEPPRANGDGDGQGQGGGAGDEAPGPAEAPSDLPAPMPLPAAASGPVVGDATGAVGARAGANPTGAEAGSDAEAGAKADGADGDVDADADADADGADGDVDADADVDVEEAEAEAETETETGAKDA